MKNRLILILVIIFFGTLLHAQDEQRVKDVVLTEKSNKIYISAGLEKDITGEIFEYLHNGVIVKIIYIINVYKEQPFYYIRDSVIESILVEKSIRYNLFEKQYYLTDGSEKIKISSRKELNKRIKKINDIFVINKNKLKDGEYYLKIRAWMESLKLFPPISWIFDIVSNRGFDTSWVRKEIK